MPNSFFRFSTAYPLERLFTLIVSGLVVILGAITYLAMGATFSLKSETIFGLLVADIVVLLFLAVLIVLKLVKLWLRYHQKIAASKLHFRLTALFGAMAIAPAVLMVVFSSLFFHYGVQSWFSDQVKKALDESLSVAKSYLEEHQQVIGRDARLMAMDLNQNPGLFAAPPKEINDVLGQIADLRQMREAVVFDGDKKVLGRSELTLALEFEPMNEASVQEADVGQVVLLESAYPGRIRALVRLNGYPARYLYVGRFVDPSVLAHVRETKDVVHTYNTLSLVHGQMEITFVLVFVIVSLLTLLGAASLGLKIAGKLVTPIEELMAAAQKMGQGDFHVRVLETSNQDELSSLKRAFNQMGNQIQQQHQEANERRLFIESVLSSVSSGVLSLSQKGILKLSNKEASHLLGQDLTPFYGKSLQKISPPLYALLQKSPAVSEHQIDVLRQGKSHTFNVHIRAHEQEYVMTFDDITNLLRAQKKAAWSHVAQQIAHEVKNPLTPIQLATERLMHKFLPQIQQDAPQFKELSETIIKYVDQIRHLIDEFSSFARMPAPQIKPHDFKGLVAQAVRLQRTAYENVDLVLESPPHPLVFSFDEKQILQAVTNILKNAVDALQKTKNPEIILTLVDEGTSVMLAIQDNGPGFPKDVAPEEWLRPYKTMGKKGTGLGLAIVQKIMEDHKGTLTLGNAPGGGALIRLIFPKT